MTLWGGRFADAPGQVLWDYTTDTSDRRLLWDDVTGSIAHVEMLGETGILPDDEVRSLLAGAAAGISELGRVSHPRGPNATCSNWWTDASSEVQRSFFLGDDVISISETRVKSDPLAALGTGQTIELSQTP